MRVILILILLMQVPAALAGPWLREEGRGFASLTLSTNTKDSHAGGLYLEYGATADLTIGVDIDLHDDAFLHQKGYGTLFVRRALGPTDQIHKWAYELGVGIGRDDGVNTTTLKTGLSWGRGFNWQDRSGWMVVDSAVIWDLRTAKETIKLDGTLGLNISDVMAAMLQINYAHSGSEGSTRIEPSLLLEPDSSPVRFRIGTSTPVDAPDETALTLGLWHEF